MLLTLSGEITHPVTILMGKILAEKGVETDLAVLE
jgi:hypothetical protein